MIEPYKGYEDKEETCEDRETDAAHALADMVELLLSALDDEMEHGHYGPPDVAPPGHEDEVDYFLEHDRIVKMVSDLRINIQDKIKEIREGAEK